MPRRFLSVVCALLLAACQPGGEVEVQADVEADAPLADLAGQRCPQCGWIESKRKLASSVADPRSLGIYEYTLRMADGSSRVFQEALPVSWRVGERLSIIDGKDSLN